MRKAFFLFLLACTCKAGFSQADTSLIYLRFPTLPPFRIIKVPDSTSFTKNELKNKRATMVIVFSPDCDHCQHETRELVKHMDQFKKVQIMMVSAMDYNLIKQFYTEYGLAPYPNIIMGRDPGYFFGTFYHVRSFPSIYLYNKKGNFVKAFEGSIPLETIAASL